MWRYLVGSVVLMAVVILVAYMLGISQGKPAAAVALPVAKQAEPTPPPEPKATQKEESKTHPKAEAPPPEKSMVVKPPAPPAIIYVVPPANGTAFAFSSTEKDISVELRVGGACSRPVLPEERPSTPRRTSTRKVDGAGVRELDAQIAAKLEELKTYNLMKSSSNPVARAETARDRRRCQTELVALRQERARLMGGLAVDDD